MTRNAQNKTCSSCLRAFVVAFIGFTAFVATGLRAADGDVHLARYAEISGVLRELRPAQLPVELLTLPTLAPDAPWNAWIAAHDAEIRGRLPLGDEDMLVNWLLHGASFTTQPDVVLPDNATADTAAVTAFATLINARLDDFVRALQSPGTDERRTFARRFFEGNGFKLDTDAGVKEFGGHLLAAISRVAAEEGAVAEQIAAADGSDRATALGIRSHLLSDRGLSLDSALETGFGVEQALAAMNARGLVKPGSVARVAIVGPGLDFATKDAGLDLYPVQTLQPFAVIDALARLGLSAAGSTPDVVCFDISPRVLTHIATARMRAAAGAPYTLSLPLMKGRDYAPEFRQYWTALGQRVGTPGDRPADARIDARAELRTVLVPAATVQRVSAANLNIITGRQEGPRFDLIIATNVFQYYDTLDQALAFANVEAMLKNGGFLLTNTPLPEILWVPMELVDSTAVKYDASGSGDEVLWYQRMAG